MNRIALDEPDQVGVIPQPITFWFRGRQYEATVASSAERIDRLLERCGGVVYDLRGEFGRAWLADPCTQALNEGLHAARLAEDKASAAARAERRRAKAALAEEEAEARRQRARTW